MADVAGADDRNVHHAAPGRRLPLLGLPFR
jgi:hypothetical protein